MANETPVRSERAGAGIGDAGEAWHAYRRSGAREDGWTEAVASPPDQRGRPALTALAQDKETTIDDNYDHLAWNRVARGRTPGDGRR
jgi:hypothetical protein